MKNREAGSNAGKILVMGIGNLLLGDEGIGVHAVHELEKCNLPDPVDLLDVGTAFIDALPHLEDGMRLIILDAVKGGGKPGSVYRIEVNPDKYCQESTSLHGVSILNMLKFAKVSIAETVTILGVEPAVIDWSMELSGVVETAKPRLIEAVLREINDILFALHVQTA